MNSEPQIHNTPRARHSVHLQTLIRSLMLHCALIVVAAACYLAIFVLLIHSLAIHARPASGRQLPLQTTTTLQTGTLAPHAVAASCAEFAGMGQRLCNAEAKVEAARAEFQPRIAARKQHHVRPPGERVKSAPNPPAQEPVSPAEFPDEEEPLSLSVAFRE